MQLGRSWEDRLRKTEYSAAQYCKVLLTVNLLSSARKHIKNATEREKLSTEKKLMYWTFVRLSLAKKLSFWPNLLYLFPGWAEKAEKSWLPFFVEKAAQWCFSASAAHLLLPKMVVVYQMSNGIISIITKSSRLVHHNFGTLVPNQKVVAQENDQSNRRYWDVRNPKTFVAEQELQWMSFTTKKSHFVPKIVKVGWVRWSELQNLKS